MYVGLGFCECSTHAALVGNSTAKLEHLQDGWSVSAGRLIGTHAHEVMSIVQHLMSHCDVEAGSTDKPVQVLSHIIITPY